jgi:hypothetical protein
MATTEEEKATVRSAAQQQIHAAIDHLNKSEYASAITLGSAAEGILPKTDKPHLFPKLQAKIASLPAETGGASGINAFNNWAKHGGSDKAAISELEVIATISRAVSKFGAVYGEQSAQMKAFVERAIKRLEADKDTK